MATYQVRGTATISTGSWCTIRTGVKKLGSKLLAETENRIASLGGKRIYVETSSREQYVSTRTFYLKNNYIEDAVIKDFYDENDSKVIYVKVLS